MGRRARRARRAFEVTRVARRGRLLRVLREVGAVGSERPATAEGARAFRRSLEELGTTYVKLGQLLSSRPDLLPDAYIDELSALVDDVPPVAFANVRETIEAEIGLDLFARLDEEPIASASIGQIHGALLRTGRDVVVKVRRPGIADEVALDLELLRSLTSLAEGHSETARLLQLSALADELEVHLSAELDFVEEAHGSEVIAGLVSEFEHLRVPQVVHPHVTERVLVLERTDGEKVTASHDLDPEQAQLLARELFRPTSSRSPCTASITPTHTGGTSCSRPTGDSCCSTSACSAVSTTTPGGRSACCCWRSRRTGPRMSLT